MSSSNRAGFSFLDRQTDSGYYAEQRNWKRILMLWQLEQYSYSISHGDDILLVLSSSSLSLSLEQNDPEMFLYQYRRPAFNSIRWWQAFWSQKKIMCFFFAEGNYPRETSTTKKSKQSKAKRQNQWNNNAIMLQTLTHKIVISHRIESLSTRVWL